MYTEVKGPTTNNGEAEIFQQYSESPLFVL